MSEQHIELSGEEIEMVLRHRARCKSPWLSRITRAGHVLVCSIVVVTVAVAWFQAANLADDTTEALPAPLSWFYGLIH
ncbi:hypothetical protein [Ectopseudomonas chengduensis]|uniref:hypothetical protein n=1 Tax=Ectopseudomonas chengduensis TaxID=489632 RepID=UPI000AEC03A8|nr:MULTISPECIES: hypothetical protein [Pseudomonas]MBP3062027.1 hypothetical protein [Pseudomonas chengduensis]NNB75320.1 hypothetical protein [Pseudomonas chengduensis]